MSDTNNCAGVKSNGRIKISLRDLLYLLVLVAGFAANTGIIYAKLDRVQEDMKSLKVDVECIEKEYQRAQVLNERRITRVETELNIRMGP